MIIETLSRIKPRIALDVGCGSGYWSAQFSAHCGCLVAIDNSKHALMEAMGKYARANLTYICMDGRRMGFSDGQFEAVLEKSSLHHFPEWPRVLEEMLRVSARYILIQEPIDNLRNETKKRSLRAHQLWMEIQAELGEPEQPHLLPEIILEAIPAARLNIEHSIILNDNPLSFQEFFRGFDEFMARSIQPAYWQKRLDDLHMELGNNSLNLSDILFVKITKM